MPHDAFGRALRRAEAALVKADRRFAGVVRAAGPCTLERSVSFVPFEALLRAITSQQLSGKAAATILRRVSERLNDGAAPSPEQVLRARLPTLRACGLSRNKALAVKDLARKTLAGVVPTAQQLDTIDDTAIIERLTTVRGIGPWTVQMMLMFHLGRLDVMPADDLGVRKGFTRLASLEALIAPRALLAEADAWRPYRSVAAWYCWRALDV